MVEVKPDFSVIIPLHNHAEYIRRAISSVFSGSVQDLEIVVVDDGSTDRGPEVVQGIEDGRIRLIRQQNQGVSAARNRGLAEARADMIAFLDSDDEWLPGFLGEICKLRLKYPMAEVYASAYLSCEGQGRTTKDNISNLGIHPWDGLLDNYFEVASRSDPPVWSSAVAMKKSAIDSIGGFPVGVTSGEDLVTWARLAARYRIAYTNTPSAVYWRPEFSLAYKPRVPQIPDVVGRMLGEIAPELPSPGVAALRKYQALWHKIRAVDYMALGRCRDARAELRLAIALAGVSRKRLLLWALCLLPGNLAAMAIKARRLLLRKLGLSTPWNVHSVSRCCRGRLFR
jgi:glycosyltransferase involved in cell wall biosynthesis